MRYDDYWWYRGYVIGTYQLEFNIQVAINITDVHKTNTSSSPSPSPAPVSSVSSFSITAPAAASDASLPSSDTPPTATIAVATPPTPSNSQETIQITPSRGFVLNSDRSVSVRLLGDLDSYRQIQNLDGHWVMIPVQPGIDPNKIYSQNEDMWVILPPTMVTTTGECNKVGVSYTSFRIQSEKCNQPVGSCLRNQIYDLGEEDNARIADGMEPLYNITRYGGGFKNLNQIDEGENNGGALSLRLPIKGIRTSLVTLEVKADDVQLVVNRAPGKILSSEVCTFDGVHCGGFTAISGTGFLKVKVQNTGAVAAEFRAGILGCSGGVLPAVEEYAAIAPASTHNFTFDIRMETDQEGNRTCTVVVTDSAGDIADSTMVSFYTNSTVYEPPPDQSDLGDKVRKMLNVYILSLDSKKRLLSLICRAGL
jgi:Male gamete fusion factor